MITTKILHYTNENAINMELKKLQDEGYVIINVQITKIAISIKLELECTALIVYDTME